MAAPSKIADALQPYVVYVESAPVAFIEAQGVPLVVALPCFESWLPFPGAPTGLHCGYRRWCRARRWNGRLALPLTGSNVSCFGGAYWVQCQ